MTTIRGQVCQHRLGFLKTAIMGHHGAMRNLLNSEGRVGALKNLSRCGQLKKIDIIAADQMALDYEKSVKEAEEQINNIS